MAEYKQRVLFTFDVEAGHSKESINTLIWGRTCKGEYWGLKEQIELLDDYGVKGLFFVDFAEVWDYGESAIKDVVDYIISKGHDVGVHIHPHHMGDSRQFLYEYTRDEQYEIINQCTMMYTKMVGHPPLSFRAGKYGANYDTLDIICDLGYKYDFSEFYSQRWCGLVPPLCFVKPTVYKSIIEFPVTVFRSFTLGKLYTRFDKLEIDIDSHEMLSIIRKYSKMRNGVVITLFAHSFSFLDFRGREENPRVIKKNVKKFISCLEQITNTKECLFISENDLKTIPVDNNVDSENNIASNSLLSSIPYLYFRSLSMINYNRKAQVLVFGSMALIILLLFLVISIVH